MNLDALFDDDDDVRVAFRPISTDARRALKQELVPSKPVAMAVPQFVLEMTAQLRAAVKDKDEWYTRLIRYKSIDQVDEAFFDDLIYVLAEWAQAQGVDAPSTTLAPPPLPESTLPPVAPVAPVAPSGDAGAVQVLRDVLLDALRPDQNLTPWALTASLNEIFQTHQIRAKAQVVPASLDKISTSIAGSKKLKQLVAVIVGEGFTPIQIDLRFHHGMGWFDPRGIGSPETSARSILGHVVEQMF